MSTETSTQWLLGPQNTKFFTRLYLSPAPKAVIVFVHGFCDHCSRYVEWHTRFADAGYSVFTWDQRGFGRTAQDREEKSPGTAYSKQSWATEMQDLNWAIGRAMYSVPGVPVFIMGQSMGGGEVLGFGTEGETSAYAPTRDALAGVIATSPIVQQSTPISWFLRTVLAILAVPFPNVLFPADLGEHNMSRDPRIAAEYVTDPLVTPKGAMRCITDMLSKGLDLQNFRWKEWPRSLPLCIIHGTEDKITSQPASKAFFDQVDCASKTYLAVEGAYHELSNELPDVRTRVLKQVIDFIDGNLAAKA